METPDKVFKIRMGSRVKIGEDHFITVINVVEDRWCHTLYVKEEDSGLNVNHAITVFNKDIMYMNGLVHLTGPNLAALLCPGEKTEEG